MIARISIKMGITFKGRFICIGTSAKTAAARPFGKIIDIIAASEIEVPFAINRRQRHRRPIYKSVVKIITLGCC